ncbi:acyl-CoA dehydrogenase family protein [Enemella sp. A6]|uniref:acyl-CoA dehydrogenase family protein n=1 Tax=Enemella sp. A6 TaxID=3440152 RepID=UPI003EBC1357
MDFTFTEEQDAAADLARRSCRGRTPGYPTGFDRELWQQANEAGLLTLHLPEPHGTGLGMIAACRALIEFGRAAAAIPAAAQVAATAVLAESTAAERLAEAPIVLPALAENTDAAPNLPAVTARAANGWVLEGHKTVVPHGAVADLWLVTATDPDGPAVFLVTPDDGVRVTEDTATGGLPVAHLDLTGVELPADRRLGGAEVALRLRRALTLTTAAVQYGVSQRALELTADYTAEREQFDQPLGAFQAVRQRLGDAYIDLGCQRLTLWQAAWRWEAGVPLGSAVETAGYWAAEGGNLIAHSAVHLHGGAGVDLDGAAHHYFTATKQLEFTVGGATRQALEIGDIMAAGSIA